MTSPRLLQITRELNRKKQLTEKAPASGTLGETLEQLIAEQVEQRVSQELERQQPTGLRLQRLLRQGASSPPVPSTDYRQIPPPRTELPKDLTALIHRDAEGRAAWVDINGLKYEVQRDSLGRLLRMVRRSESPVLPALEIPFKADAREYHDGEPR